MGDYFHAVAADTFGPELEQPRITSASAPLYMRLREHVCVSPAVPMPPDEDAGVMNAFFPRLFPREEVWAVGERGGRLGVRRKGGGRAEEWVYETWGEGGVGSGSHDEERCGMCKERREREERARKARRRVDVDVDEDCRMEEEGCLCEGDSGCGCGECAEGQGADGADEEEEDDARIQRIRRAVQDALGRDTDLEQFLAHVAREADVEHGHGHEHALDSDTEGEGEGDADADADDASVYSYSAAPSDSDGSTVGEDRDLEGLPGSMEGKAGRTCDGVLDVIITGEVCTSLSLCVYVVLTRSLALFHAPAPVFPSCIRHHHSALTVSSHSTTRPPRRCRPRAPPRSHGATSASTAACAPGTGSSCSCAHPRTRARATRMYSAGMWSAGTRSWARGGM